MEERVRWVPSSNGSVMTRTWKAAAQNAPGSIARIREGLQCLVFQEVEVIAMKQQQRDFFVVPVAMRLRNSEQVTWLPMFARTYGQELCDALVARLRSEPSMRRLLIREMRAAWWWLRNDRWTQHAHTMEKVSRVLEIDELLQLAGVRALDLHQLADCLSHGCVCDGCDLWDGQRFVDCYTLEVDQADISSLQSRG